MRLSAKNLKLQRGGRTLVESLTFEAAPGKGVVLKGPNGSGKTTLLRTLAGFLSPAEGEIVLEGGYDDEPLATHCHYLGHLNAIKPAHSVFENLMFYAEYLDHGGPGTDHAAAGCEQRAWDALNYLRLAAIADVPAGYLSAGQKRRLGLARLLAARRPVWLLDEPTTSLDRQSSDLVAEMFNRHLAGGGLLIVATHIPLGVGSSHEIDLAFPGGVAA